MCRLRTSEWPAGCCSTWTGRALSSGPMKVQRSRVKVFIQWLRQRSDGIRPISSFLVSRSGLFLRMSQKLKATCLLKEPKERHPVPFTAFASCCKSASNTRDMAISRSGADSLQRVGDVERNSYLALQDEQRPLRNGLTQTKRSFGSQAFSRRELR